MALTDFSKTFCFITQSYESQENSINHLNPSFGLIPLIAKNYVGYKNIIELSSKSYLENLDNENPHCNIDDLLKLSRIEFQEEGDSIMLVKTPAISIIDGAIDDVRSFLEKENKQIGIVTHGQGLSWLQLTLTGKESHTGSTPMPMRVTAGLGMAQITQLVHDIAIANAPLAVGAIGH